RHRERPGLRGEIADATAHDAGLLLHLAPHRLLDVLARLDEAGEARPHRRGEACRAPEQAVLALDRQHDHDRVGAGKMLDLAGWALTLPAALDSIGGRPAVGAKERARVPGGQTLGLEQ